VNAAGAHLKQVFGQEPRDVAAKARWGVVKAWQQNYEVATNYLSVVAEKDPATLDFLISLMQSAQRKRLAQVITSHVCLCVYLVFPTLWGINIVTRIVIPVNLTSWGHLFWSI